MTPAHALPCLAVVPQPQRIPVVTTTDDVLQAVRDALPTDAINHLVDGSVISSLSVRQRPLIPVLIALLDSLEAVSGAIADNAIDEGVCIDRTFAAGLQQQAARISSRIYDAAHAPEDWAAYRLPSMTGKELV